MQADYLRICVSLNPAPDVHIERVHGFGSAAGQVLRVFLINKMESRGVNSIAMAWLSCHFLAAFWTHSRSASFGFKFESN